LRESNPRSSHRLALHAPSSSNGRLIVRLSLAVWGTGQDQVAVIKRQLQLLLPSLSIFLDVDDLADIGELESYISQSAVVLLFLSRGYFQVLSRTTFLRAPIMSPTRRATSPVHRARTACARSGRQR